jgi:hypothetical protein
MFNVADCAPTLSANNTTMILQLLPVASEDGHRLIGMNSKGPVPGPGVTDTLPSDTLPAPVF